MEELVAQRRVVLLPPLVAEHLSNLAMDAFLAVGPQGRHRASRSQVALVNPHAWPNAFDNPAIRQCCNVG